MTSAYENFVIVFVELNMKLRVMAMMFFKYCGFGHLEEEIVMQVLMVAVISPFFIFLTAVAIERRLHSQEREVASEKV